MKLLATFLLIFGFHAYGVDICHKSYATYICDRATLIIANYGEAATEKTSVQMLRTEECLEQAKLLNHFRSRIFALTVIAVCDRGELLEYALHPSGDIKLVAKTSMLGYEKCWQQAQSINGP